MQLEDILERPIMTEKSESAKERGIYAFWVKNTATRIEIRKAVEKFFGVKVKKVNTLKRSGKMVRRGQKRREMRLPGQKKAYVFLKPGEKIKLLETEGKTQK